MCGIVGFFGTAADSGSLAPAIEILRHRGPDGEGSWYDSPFAFGHRRLSIIDLDAGAQPMSDISGRYIIVFNGEIYNYLELKRELKARGAQFRTGSDTEVILECYRHFGVQTASKLVGMFAFAIADRRNRTLYLARDRLGEKPLYTWRRPSGDLVFASEIKAITCLPDFICEIDPVSLGGFLLLNYVAGEEMLLRGISRFPAGTCQLLHLDGRSQREVYWSPTSHSTITQDTALNGEAAVDELAKRIDGAVEIALRSDVPVTVFLSGGIDSSLIAESAARQGHLRHAYCLDFEDARFSEWKNAKQVADGLGLELRRAVAAPLTPDGFARLIYHADDPLADSSAVAVDALAREVAKDYKVALSGDGGDELFAGYLTYKATEYFKLLRMIVPPALVAPLRSWLGRLSVGGGKVTTAYKLQRFLRAWALTPAMAHFSWNGAWLPADANSLLAPSLRDKSVVDRAAERLISRLSISPDADLRSLQIADATEYLPNDILTKVDRVTMSHGLESRAPFLNPTLAEFGIALDEGEKNGLWGPPKKILRTLARRTFPPEISQAKKQGFSIPVHSWLRSEMRESLETYISVEALDKMPFLDRDAVLARKQDHLSGRTELGFELWGLMALSAWWSQQTDRSRTARRPNAGG